MTTATLESLGANKTFGGWTKMFSHASETCSCEMKFSVFLPPQAESGPVPVLYWLSGLTCTHENFITKAGAQQYAAEAGLMLVVPDTSPRGAGIEGEDERYDLGTGAGFYLNATVEKWAQHYRMDDYIVNELPKLIHANFPTNPERESIFGHSMGGHGALTLALKNPERFRSVSAFAPICAPSQCPWGQQALESYLGNNPEAWAQHDANALIQSSSMTAPLLVDQGSEDQFMEELNYELFRKTCEAKGYPATFRMQPGYDHSYYFIATFMKDHIRHHARALISTPTLSPQ